MEPFHGKSFTLLQHTSGDAHLELEGDIPHDWTEDDPSNLLVVGEDRPVEGAAVLVSVSARSRCSSGGSMRNDFRNSASGCGTSEKRHSYLDGGGTRATNRSANDKPLTTTCSCWEDH